MDLGLNGKHAIVCASSRGLGRGCAMALAEAGCDLTLNGRDADALKATATEIRNRFGVKVTEIVGDVSQPAIQAELLAASPSTDILVNNNGGPPPRDFRELDRNAILEGVTQNMVTPIELVKAVIDGMVERRFGRIVNITSLSVYQPIAGLDLSSGARAGLTSFLSGVAKSVAKHNVTINSILPGSIDTDRIRKTTRFKAEKEGISEDEALRESAARIPAGRLGTAEEFGQACAFLCSVHAGYITGQNLRIDGGAYPGAF